MLRKLKAGRGPRRKAKKKPPYRSLCTGPSPEERLGLLLKEGKGRIKPLSAEDFERFLAQPSAWPEDESIDDFLAWRRRTRKEAR